jgi:molybdate transport system substrate-binding protein
MKNHKKIGIKISAFLAALFLLVSFSCSSEKKGSLYIAAGAGYKKPILEISKNFTEDTGIAVFPIFGNMQTVSTQVQQSGQVGVLIGDRSFLENPKLGISYSEFQIIGRGKLVLAYSSHSPVDGVSSLLEDRIEKISMPDKDKAIYGKAAYEFLNATGIWNDLEPKILIASTVPQVSSYLISEEIDAGFINLTDAIAIKDQIGGYYQLEENVPEIEIVAGIVKDFAENKEVGKFTAYLQEEKSLEILESYGL